MNCIEAQQEELEVLRSIYDGDDLYKEVDDTTIQYKIGEDGNFKSFLLEIKWGESYPVELPIINLDTFYNKHIIQEVKDKIVTQAQEQAEQLLETAMTYTIIEWVKENTEDLLQDQPDTPPQIIKEESSDDRQNQKKQKKETLTKAQKRRMYDKFGAANVNAEEKPRGWDWVDIVKHLSQTGSQSADG